LKPEWSKRIFIALMGEAVEAALAEGITLEKYEGRDPRVMLVRRKEDLPAALQALPAGSPKGNSGIWYDIKVRHRKTETEFVTGEVVRIGRNHGLPMLMNAQVAQMIKEMEEGQRSMSWDNLRSLEKLADARLP
jgi:ketopantoate reductase